jgi:hypothetical protein
LGSYIATIYINKYPQKVVGIVEFGCIPITFYNLIKLLARNLTFRNRDIPREKLINEVDHVYDESTALLKREGTPSSLIIKNKYTMLALILILNMEVFDNVFEWRRNYQKILKLITFGRRDEHVELKLLN